MSQRNQTSATPASRPASPPLRSEAAEELLARRVDSAHAPVAPREEETLADESLAVPPQMPHDELAEEESILAELAASEPAYSPEQLRHQTLQLATLLGQRQRQLDRRETELNAQTAKLEKELRSAQMWSRERQFELQQRELKQQQQAEELAQRQQGVHSAHSSLGNQWQVRQAELDHQATQLKQQASQLAEREAELARREVEFELARKVRQAKSLHGQRELAAERQRLEHRRQQTTRMFADMARQLERRRLGLERQRQQNEADLAQRAQSGSLEVEQALAELSARKQALNEHAALLDGQQAELEQQRQALTAARTQHEYQLAQQQHAWQEQRQLWQSTRRETESQLQRRRESLDQRARSLQALHEEVTQRNREALELRLGVEQIWNQLAGKAAPAELTRRLGQFRGKLAEQQREERLLSERRRNEIMALAADLQHKQAGLRERQQELARWAARRNEDLEEQAARLVAREQELDRQEQLFVQGQEEWASQRGAYQQKLRRLQAQLRRIEEQTPVA